MTGAPALQLDHVVVAAATLADGVAWCEKTLGIVVPPARGSHSFMATHNRIFSIASPQFPRCYFEIIAIDPAGVAPAGPRWFGLDEPALQRAVADGPKLIQWVARCHAIDAAAAMMRAAGFDPGASTAAQRQTPSGLLRWNITIRADGRRFGDGALPILIEWGDAHPSASLPLSVVALSAVTLSGIPETLAAWLGSVVGIDRTGAAPIQLTLETPRGRFTLDSWRSEG